MNSEIHIYVHTYMPQQTQTSAIITFKPELQTALKGISHREQEEQWSWSLHKKEEIRTRQTEKSQEGIHYIQHTNPANREENREQIIIQPIRKTANKIRYHLSAIKS